MNGEDGGDGVRAGGGSPTIISDVGGSDVEAGLGWAPILNITSSLAPGGNMSV